MVRRLQLHEEFLKIPNVKNAYFQPPQSVLMEYPCIRYSSGEPEQRYANSMNYKHTKRYDGVVIDRDPESSIPEQLLEKFPMCRLGKPYVTDNLYHFPFTIYY